MAPRIVIQHRQRPRHMPHVIGWDALSNGGVRGTLKMDVAVPGTGVQRA
jgi:hypothetical protein